MCVFEELRHRQTETECVAGVPDPFTSTLRKGGCFFFVFAVVRVVRNFTLFLLYKNPSFFFWVVSAGAILISLCFKVPTHTLSLRVLL